MNNALCLMEVSQLCLGMYAIPSLSPWFPFSAIFLSCLVICFAFPLFLSLFWLILFVFMHLPCLECFHLFFFLLFLCSSVSFFIRLQLYGFCCVVCEGTMTFGERNSYKDASKQLHMATDLGINFIDSAEM